MLDGCRILNGLQLAAGQIRGGVLGAGKNWMTCLSLFHDIDNIPLFLECGSLNYESDAVDCHVEEGEESV
jgi:hypothetical protein